MKNCTFLTNSPPETVNGREFWDRVNRLIRKRRLNQEQVAFIIGIKYSTLRNWSYRKIIPYIQHIINIAKALDTSINYLLFGVDIEPSTNINYKIGKTLLSLIDLIKEELMNE
jgi:transcriptional regulator with XRE-family HTH domain